jgi:hypothetical protein
VHRLLGKLALQLQDKTLLREAKRFLTLLKQSQAVAELEGLNSAKGVLF